LVHDVFAALWLRRTSLTIHDSLTAYLFGAVRNRAVEMVRHATVARRTAQGVTDDLRRAQDSPAAHTDSAVLNDEIAAAVRDALATLPELARQVLILRWQQQLSYPEIARVLDTTEAAAKQLGSRAQRALRPALRRIFGDPPTSEG
jgi:RNA polymerase sigma-70 factor (ECF subfamily)